MKKIKIERHTTHIMCNHSNGKDCCICTNHDCLNAKCDIQQQTDKVKGIDKAGE